MAYAAYYGECERCWAGGAAGLGKDRNHTCEGEFFWEGARQSLSSSYQTWTGTQCLKGICTAYYTKGPLNLKNLFNLRFMVATIIF